MTEYTLLQSDSSILQILTFDILKSNSLEHTRFPPNRLHEAQEIAVQQRRGYIGVGYYLPTVMTTPEMLFSVLHSSFHVSVGVGVMGRH